MIDHLSARRHAQWLIDQDDCTNPTEFGPVTELAKAYLDLEKQCNRLANSLFFYADPDTYFAIAFLSDPPCGDFINDFSETPLGEKPGKLARDVLAKCEVTGEYDE